MSSVSLHVGVAVYADAYVQPLKSPVRDAIAMYGMARDNGYTWLGQPLPPWDGTNGPTPPNVLLDEQATLKRFGTALGEACAHVDPGDRLFVTFSGHGAWLDDGSGRIDEDQALVMYDRLLRDDTIYWYLSKLPRDARAYFIADSCHSQSVVELTPEQVRERGFAKTIGNGLAHARWGFEKSSYRENAGVDCEEGHRPEMNAFVAQFSACRRDQVAYDGAAPGTNSLFTGNLLRVWDGGAFNKSCPALVDALVSLSYSEVVPTITTLGPNGAAREAFLAATPFK
jgi:hypothetical protein